MPIEQIKDLETMVNPLLDGFPVISESKGLFSGGLTGEDLAERLGVNPGTVSRNSEKGDDHFAQWSRLPKGEGKKGTKKADPDNLAWVRRGGLYYPLT